MVELLDIGELRRKGRDRMILNFNSNSRWLKIRKPRLWSGVLH